MDPAAATKTIDDLLRLHPLCRLQQQILDAFPMYADEKTFGQRFNVGVDNHLSSHSYWKRTFPQTKVLEQRLT